jgi:glycosyltransferase involved in cell wall biosynthesis
MYPLEPALQLELGRRPWVAYAGPFPFPWGQACSRRVAGVASSIVATGRDVVVLGGREPEGLRMIDEHESGARLWLVGTDEEPRAGTGILRRNIALHGTAGRSAVQWLDAQDSSPSHVIVYGGGLSYASRLRSWARRRHVAIVADVVEWYSPRQFRGGMASPAWISAHLALRFAYPRFDGIIAISEFLQRHFETPSLPVVKIPPTLDVKAVAVAGGTGETGSDDGHGLVLCYFGTPGKKDWLPQIVKGFAKARAETFPGNEMTLLIAGPSQREVEAGVGGTLPTGVKVIGRLPQEQVAEFVQSADFSLLLRPQAKYSAAGFPTKFVESLANGTPVITNLTSDLHRYLVDGSVGLTVDEPSSLAVASAISRAAAMPRQERLIMRARARQTALDGFDFRAHVESVDEFLKAATP